MEHHIAVGAPVLRSNRLLLARHTVPGRFDFWAPSGGSVGDGEELEAAVARETFEETRVMVHPKQLAYIDELIDDSGRMVKFWFVADYLSGEIDTALNPALEEAVTEAGWFAQNALPAGHVFPEIIRSVFWEPREAGFEQIRRLSLQHSIF
ncbi:NUDIX domain-containing protein [Ruegeria sp. SCPT10]|uniref:NUDIX domain-containing protein n=1 Tax=Ruegeria sp. SCP10 TaxID=3141377 RepID=UPI003337902D